MQAEKQQILTRYERRKDTFFANRPLTGVTITFIRCFYRVTGVSIGQGAPANPKIDLNDINYKLHSYTCFIIQCDSKRNAYPEPLRLVINSSK